MFDIFTQDTSFFYSFFPEETDKQKAQSVEGDLVLFGV